MYDFDSAEDSYSLPHDIGGQAALNDFNREIFNIAQSFPDEDAFWQDVKNSEFGSKVFELMTQFDNLEYNGSSIEKEE